MGAGSSDSMIQPVRAARAVREATAWVCDAHGTHIGQGLVLSLQGEVVLLTCHHVIAGASPETLRVAVPDPHGGLGSLLIPTYHASRSRPDRDAVVLRLPLASRQQRPLLHALDPVSYDGTLPKRATGYTHMATQVFDARLGAATRLELPVTNPGPWPDPPVHYVVPYAFRLAETTDARTGVSGAVVAYEGGVLGLAHFARSAGAAHERELYLVPLSAWTEGWRELEALVEPLIDQALRDAAVVKRVRDLRVGIGDGQASHDPDLVIAAYRADVHVERPQEGLAEQALEGGRGLLVIGRPKSGKTRLVWDCLRKRPDVLVVMPRDPQPPAEFEQAGLAGRDVILLCDDLHNVAESLQPLRWRDRLAETVGRVRVVATIRDGREWKRVRDNQSTLLDALNDRDRVFLSRVGERGDDLPVELSWQLARRLGIDEAEFRNRFDGTPGSLTLDLADMAARYDRLREERIGEVAASRLLDSLKLLHEGGQAPFAERLVRIVAAQIRGDGRIAPETWEALCRRTQEEGFGSFADREFRTYQPYLEECVRYAPAPEELDLLFELLRAQDAWLRVVSLGVARSRRAEPVQAARTLRAAIESGHADVAGLATFTLGVVLAEQEDLDGAEQAWHRAEELGVLQATLNLGVLCERRGDLEGAEAAYRRAEDRGDWAAPFNLGNVLRKRGDVVGAEAAYRRGDSGGDPNAAFGLALLLDERGEFEEAEAAYRRADRTGPDASFNLGVLLRKRGDLEGAEAAWRSADERGDARAAVGIGNLLLERRDLEGAEAAWRRGDERGDAVGAFNLGNLLRSGGNLEGAQRAYERADERGHATAALYVGFMLQQLGDLEGTAAAWLRAEERGDPSAAYNLGLLFMQSGKLDAAEAAYQRADERGDAEAAFSLAYLLHQRSDLDGAEAAYRRAEERSHPSAAANLGIVLLESGKLKEAEAAYRRADDQGHLGAAYSLGSLLEQRGDLDGAEAAYRRAQKSDDARLVEVATAALAELPRRNG